MIVRGKAEGSDVTILIDTGSQATLVSTSLVSSLRLQDSIRPSTIRLTSFSKDKIPNLGQIDLNVTMAGMTGRQTCVIVQDMECDVLAGMDFLSKHDIAILTGAGLVSSKWGTTPCIDQPTQIDRRSKVRATETYIVPPRSVMFIKGTIEGIPQKRTVYSGYVEPYDNLATNHGIVVAGALVYSEQGQVPVRVMNMSNDPVVLYKRKLVGLLNPYGSKKVCQVAVHHAGDCGDSTDKTDTSRGRPAWTRDRLFEELKVREMPLQDELLDRMKNILWQNRDCFSVDEYDLGKCNFYKARIPLKPGAKPVHVPPIPIPYKHRDAFDEHLQGMERSGIIKRMS